VEYALLHANSAAHGRVSRLCVGRRALAAPEYAPGLAGQSEPASLVRRVGWSGSPRRSLRGFATQGQSGFGGSLRQGYACRSVLLITPCPDGLGAAGAGAVALWARALGAGMPGDRYGR
jgi:hypothetical protein